jgi:hypothetical protein
MSYTNYFPIFIRYIFYNGVELSRPLRTQSERSVLISQVTHMVGIIFENPNKAGVVESCTRVMFFLSNQDVII